MLIMVFLGLRKLGNICCGHKMFLNKIRNIFCVPDTKFVSATNVARAGKRGNICVGNNVSATMCPRLPGSLRGQNVVSATELFRKNGHATRGKLSLPYIPLYVLTTSVLLCADLKNNRGITLSNNFVTSFI